MTKKIGKESTMVASLKNGFLQKRPKGRTEAESKTTRRNPMIINPPPNKPSIRDSKKKSKDWSAAKPATAVETIVSVAKAIRNSLTNVTPWSGRSNLKRTQSKAAAPMSPKDWEDVLKVPAGEFHAAVRAKLFPRETEMKIAARRAYETAPIGDEVEAVWTILKGYRNLEAAEVLAVGHAMPSKRLKDDLWSVYWPIQKRRNAAAERREVARRRKVLASIKVHK